MLALNMLTAWVFGALARLGGSRAEDDPRDRGDVPGWVMVTVMTAGLVVIIFAAFRQPIVDAVTDAVQSVTDGTSDK